MRVKVTMHIDVPDNFSAGEYGSAIHNVRKELARRGLRTSVWHVQYVDGPHATPEINALGATGRPS